MTSRREKTLEKQRMIQERFRTENPDLAPRQRKPVKNPTNVGLEDMQRQAEQDIRLLEENRKALDENTFWTDLKERPKLVRDFLSRYASLMFTINEQNLLPWFMERHVNVTTLITAISRDTKDFLEVIKTLEAQHIDREGPCGFQDLEFYFGLEAEYNHLNNTINQMLHPYAVYLGNEIDFAIHRRTAYALETGLWEIVDGELIQHVDINEHLAQLGIQSRDVGKLRSAFTSAVDPDKVDPASKYQNMEMPSTDVSGMTHFVETPNDLQPLLDDMRASRDVAEQMAQQAEINRMRR